MLVGRIQRQLDDRDERQELRRDRHGHKAVHAAHDNRLQLLESIQG